MVDQAPKPIVVSGNAGILDTLYAAGRYLLVIVGAVPLLLKLLGAHDFAGLVAYFRGAEGSALITAVTALIALGWGLWKTHKRGAQVATVAADTRVPESVATLKE